MSQNRTNHLHQHHQGYKLTSLTKHSCSPYWYHLVHGKMRRCEVSRNVESHQSDTDSKRTSFVLSCTQTLVHSAPIPKAKVSMDDRDVWRCI